MKVKFKELINESIFRKDSHDVEWKYDIRPFWEDLKTFYESNLSRIVKHVDGGCMMISASRGNLSETENKQRTDQLAKDIRDYGLGFVRILGGFIENQGSPEERVVTEESFFVPMISTLTDDEFFDTAINLCKKYDQDSVLISLPQDTESTKYKGFGYYDKNGNLDFLLGTQMSFSEDAVKYYFSMLVKGNNRGTKFSFTESASLIKNEWIAVRSPQSVYQVTRIDHFNENIIYRNPSKLYNKNLK